VNIKQHLFAVWYSDKHFCRWPHLLDFWGKIIRMGCWIYCCRTSHQHLWEVLFWVIYSNTILRDQKITTWKVAPLPRLEELRIHWSLTVV